MANFKHQKVSGSSAGKTASKKMDGYASGKVPDVVVGTKTGIIKGSGYSGPNVAKLPRGSA